VKFINSENKGKYKRKFRMKRLKKNKATKRQNINANHYNGIQIYE